MKMRKLIVIALALVLAVGLLAGCGSTAAPATAPAASSGDSGSSSSSGEFKPAALPTLPDLGGKEPNAWLISQDDQIPLAGVISNHIDSRADVYKALDKVQVGKKDVKIAWLSASQGTIFFTTMVQDSAIPQAKEYGYDVTVFDANFDLTTQQEQFENVLVQDYDIIVCNAVDMHAEVELYRRAVEEKGVPVIVCGPTSAKPEYPIVTTVLSGSWATGYEDGYYTAEALWGKYPNGIKMGAVINQFGDSDSESRPNGFLAGYLMRYSELAGTPYNSKWEAAVIAYNYWQELRDKGSVNIPGIIDFKQVITVNNIATSAAQPKCAELLTGHPDLDVAMCETDSFGLAMVTEVKQMGKTPGKDIIIVYGSDGTADLCRAVKNGEVLCIGTNVPYYCGAGIVNIIHDIFTGKDYNDLPANSYTPTYCVNAENIDKVWQEGQPYAAMSDWEVLTVEQYNEANK